MSSERRPSGASPSVAAKKPSGFGAGIQDDDSFGFVDDSTEFQDDFVVLDASDGDDSGEFVSPEISERETRPRRRRGRGKRPETRGGDAPDASVDPRESDEDSDDDDSSELIGRNSRIPSWQDAIGTLVATNMENHQRNQSQNRGGQRSRGPRRDR